MDVLLAASLLGLLADTRASAVADFDVATFDFVDFDPVVFDFVDLDFAEFDLDFSELRGLAMASHFHCGRPC